MELRHPHWEPCVRCVKVINNYVKVVFFGSSYQSRVGVAWKAGGCGFETS